MGLISGLFGGGNKAAKRQADATLKAAEMTAASNREAARGATLSMQTQLAQKRASDQAAELLSTPQEGATVILSPETDAPEIDEVTRKRKTVRQQFFNTPSSGLNVIP